MVCKPRDWAKASRKAFTSTSTPKASQKTPDGSAKKMASWCAIWMATARSPQGASCLATTHCSKTELKRPTGLKRWESWTITTTVWSTARTKRLHNCGFGKTPTATAWQKQVNCWLWRKRAWRVLTCPTPAATARTLTVTNTCNKATSPRPTTAHKACTTCGSAWTLRVRKTPTCWAWAMRLQTCPT